MDNRAIEQRIARRHHDGTLDASTTLGLAIALVTSLTLGSGCQTPCTSDGDCASDQHCAEELCTTECTVDGDCEGDRFCNQRGKCAASFVPTISIVSPAAGAEVGDVFDLEVEVSFRADVATVSLERDGANVGGVCGPFSPQEIIVTGDIDQEATQRVVFRDVNAYSRFFSVRAVATANQLVATAAREFGGSPAFDFGGALIDSPAEEIIRTNPLRTELAATFNPVAGVVSAWVEPVRGAPSPRVLLSQNASSIGNVFVPIARGKQTIWVETERQGVTQRCGRGITVDPIGASNGIEVALSFESEGQAELDLWIFAEREGYEPEACNVDSSGGLCTNGEQSTPFRSSGTEVLSLPLDAGVYGIAVAPAIVGEPVSARVRLSTQGVHLGWLGPRRVFAEDGAVWLAGRIYVLNGAVTIEPLEDMIAGLPTDDVSDW